jgi:hypothetical protein
MEPALMQILQQHYIYDLQLLHFVCPHARDNSAAHGPEAPPELDSFCDVGHWQQ